MEPFGEEEAQLVFLSHKSFLSLSLTPNPLWGTTRLALQRRKTDLLIPLPVFD